MSEELFQSSTVPRQALPLSRPVAAGERLQSIDVLRGIAVLGILVINIEFFAHPMMVPFNPVLAGGFAGLDALAWKFGSLFFLEKMMSIFSMLFGAGVVLMYQRAEASQRTFGGVYYRRTLWLLLMGLFHAYLFWYGDILFAYAVIGLLLYPLRRKSARLLMILAALFLTIGILLHVGSSLSFQMLQREAAEAEQALASGQELTLPQKEMAEAWHKVNAAFNPGPEELGREIDAYRGGFEQIFKYRAVQSIMMQTQGLFFRVFWRVMGLMLLGMALMKLGVFSASRSNRFYAVLSIIGLGVGLPLVGYGISSLTAHNFGFIYFFGIGGLFNYVGSIFVSMGYVGAVMLAYKTGFFRWLQLRLAAVGRTALSNYLAQTLICTTIFYGYGFGLFGRVNRFALLVIVVGVWILLVTVSSWWLGRYRFGPAEWLWRALTYRARPAMRVK